MPNHVSYLDGPLIAAFLPGYPMFAIDTAQAAKWWVRPLLAGADIYPMDPTRPMATKSLIKALREGRQCVIFPEGRLNVTGGALMKIYDGPALIADKGEAPVLPVRIDGVEFTPFSRLARHGGRLRRHWFPKVTITLYEPRRLAIPAELRGRARRHRAGLVLYDVMSEMMARRPDPPSLFGALLAARAAHGGSHPIMADPTGGPLTYDRVIAASLVLGRRLARRTERGEAVGMMLPNSIGAGVAFLALQATGRVPAMLNHTAGIDAVLSACRTAGLRPVDHLAPLCRAGQARRAGRGAGRGRSRSSGSRICARSSALPTSSTGWSRRVSPPRGIAASASPPPTRPRSCSPRGRKARRKGSC